MESISVCSFLACDKPAHARGFCGTHYSRWRKHGDPSVIGKSVRKDMTPQDPVCRVEGCEGKPRGKSLCATHYSQQYVRPYKACVADGCVKPQSARGLCSMHATREDRASKGTARPHLNHDIDPVKKITSNIEVGLCWIWQRRLNNKGYGYTNHAGKRWYVHRLLWTELVGPIPEGLELDHLCKQPACCNPDHLEPVTHAENTRRSGSVSAQHARKTHCIRGHEFSPENTRTNQRGHRTCLACRRARDRVRKRPLEAAFNIHMKGQQ